jgi:hypothetical protein
VDCGVLFSMTESSSVVQRRKTFTGDIFSLLARWRWLRVGESNVMISNHDDDMAARYSPGGVLSTCDTLTVILETSLERGPVWRVWRSPHMEERRAEWRVGGLRACVRSVQQRK